MICNLCGGDRHRVMAAGRTYSFLRCENCRLESVSPLPKEKDLDSQYDGFATGRVVQEEFDAYATLAESSLRHHRECLSTLGEPLRRAANFLDIGFGGGHYLRAAERLGLTAYGVEIDRAAFERARQLGLTNIYCGHVDEAPLLLDSFDIVKAMHVLEHTTDPLRVLRSIFALVKPGGWAIIDVPNQASKVAHLKILLRGIGLEREQYGYLQPPVHLYGFTPKTLQAIVEKAGFRVVRTILTSPVEQLYFPTTPQYFSSLRGQILKGLYRVAGGGSYLCLYARKNGEPAHV